MAFATSADMDEKKRVLIAPLDWGLGHTTRCIPLINKLLNNNFEVILAGNGSQKVLLQKEFPTLLFLDLPGYNVHYSRKKQHLPAKMILQIPAIFKKVQKERNWLRCVTEQYKISLVVSDNRYGLYHPKIPSIFLTHQLQVISGFGKMADGLIRQMLYRFINRFTACGVIDDANCALAGKLSHPSKLPATPVYYIGLASRFERKPVDKKNFLLIIISGPEPQRQIFEDLLLAQLAGYTAPVIFVRGLPDRAQEKAPTEHITFYNHLPADRLNIYMQSANMVISRSGYTTLMDIVSLQIRSILIATPGQTEQEYLAARMHANQWAFCISEDQFNLQRHLQEAERFPYRYYPFDDRQGQKDFISLVQQLATSV